MVIKPKPDCEVQITFTKTEDGGRKGLVNVRNYRPDLRFAFSPAVFGVHFICEDKLIAPGETVTVLTFFRIPQLVVPKIKLGDCFDVMEGTRLVGVGRIVKMLAEVS